jgi:hexosaminidase
LKITEDLVQVSAKSEAGLFYGIQTLRQLLPATIESNQVQEGPWEVATGVIRDQPRFEYRGAMLDVARHFFDVEEVKTYIDYLAMYKFNALHLHLSDDQGWRIEIKSWPRLAEYGGSKEVGGGEGGYYTQEQYRELVAYAADRFITIVPEIDMPGHTQAALASYPELSCKGKDQELYTGIEVGFSTFCTDKEIVYQFIDDVIKELAALTPGPYIHIGGDESLVTPLEDYIPFVSRVQQIVVSHGKQVMGWDEIAHAKMVPNAVIQYWAEAENALMGIEKGAKVLMSPAAKTYLDMQYDSTSPLGLHWAAYIEVDDAYNWEPTKMAEGITRTHIMGIEAPLWSETLENMDDIEYMAFPRLPGHAEIGWTPAGQRDWDSYKVRLGKQKSRFETLDINFYASDRVPWSD